MAHRDEIEPITQTACDVETQYFLEGLSIFMDAEATNRWIDRYKVIIRVSLSFGSRLVLVRHRVFVGRQIRPYTA